MRIIIALNRDRDKSIERKNDNSTAGTGKIDGEIEVTKQHMKVKKENSSGGGGGGGGVKSQMENQSPKEQVSHVCCLYGFDREILTFTFSTHR